MPALAQPAVQVQVNSGSVTDQRRVRSAALTVTPIVTLHDTPRSSLSVFASGTQFTQSARPLTVGTGALFRTPPTNALGAQLAADGAYTSTTFGARFSTAQVAPSLVWRRGVVTLDAGVRAAHGPAR